MMSATTIVMTVATSFIHRNDMEYIAYRNPLDSKKTKNEPQVLGRCGTKGGLKMVAKSLSSLKTTKDSIQF